MVRDNRIKTLTFTLGSLTSDADGNFSTYGENPINGEIVKVAYEAGDIANNGSVALQTSGAEELLWVFLDADSSQTDYLHKFTVDSARATGSPSFGTRPAAGGYDGVLQVWGSGCGNAKSASGLTVFYI